MAGPGEVSRPGGSSQFQLIARAVQLLRSIRKRSPTRVRVPKLPDASRAVMWEEALGLICRARLWLQKALPSQARAASKCSSRRSGRLGSQQNPELVKMRTGSCPPADGESGASLRHARTSASEGHFPSLPRIANSVRAAGKQAASVLCLQT